MLVLRALGLGDLLVAVPALRGLRRAYPEHRLVLATRGWLSDVVALTGVVDALVPTPGLGAPLPPVGPVDIAVNLHGNGPESRAMLARAHAGRLVAHRAPHGRSGPLWLPRIHERDRWVRLVGAFGVPADPHDVSLLPPTVPSPATGAAVVHVGASAAARRWPYERFAAVAAGLAEQGHEVVVTGDGTERQRALAVARRAGLDAGAVLAGRLALGELAALVSAARLVVSVDTGAAHLASAYAVPSVVLFGPARPQEWGPPPGPHVVLTDPGARIGDVTAAVPDPALLAVTAGDVLDAVASLPVAPGRRAATARPPEPAPA